MVADNSQRFQALVTGASSGIGAAFAERLARDGHDLTIVARRGDRLAALAGQLQERYNVQVEAFAADLSDSQSVRSLETRISAGAPLELLVNNAGFGLYKPLVEIDPDEAEKLINLQVLAVTRLTRAALPGMIARRRGSIINVASNLAFSASMGSSQMAARATYVGTKAYIITFTRLLESELEGTGVRAQALCPGIVRTEFNELAGIDASRLAAALVMEPEAVVQASLAGLKLGEVICMPGLEDPALLTQLQADERRLFELARSGRLAERYR